MSKPLTDKVFPVAGGNRLGKIRPVKACEGLMKDLSGSKVTPQQKAIGAGIAANDAQSPTGSEIARAESSLHLTRAAFILSELADELEFAASRAGVATDLCAGLRRNDIVGENIRDLRERSGHLRYLAATTFKSPEA